MSPTASATGSPCASAPRPRSRISPSAMFPDTNTSAMAGMRYEQSGVSYDKLDAFKRACQREAASTVAALARYGLSEPAGVRGESAYLIETADEYLAHVEEGLGTKN